MFFLKNINIDNIEAALELKQTVEDLELRIQKLSKMKDDVFEKIDSKKDQVTLIKYSHLLKNEYEVFIESTIRKLTSEVERIKNKIKLL